MVAELEPEQEPTPKKENASVKVFSQTEIRQSIVAHRQRIKELFEAIEQADEQLKIKRKVANRKKAITDLLNDKK